MIFKPVTYNLDVISYRIKFLFLFSKHKSDVELFREKDVSFVNAYSFVLDSKNALRWQFPNETALTRLSNHHHLNWYLITSTFLNYFEVQPSLNVILSIL